jgi:Cu2+-exporting ATPase
MGRDVSARRDVLGTGCAHCGLAVPPGRLALEDTLPFCCTGCEAAWGILQAGGLTQYYALPERRALAVERSGRQYQEFDHPAFGELYVESTAAGRCRTELYLEGVHCGSCVWLVERVPLLVAGVARTELDIRRSRAQVEWDPAVVNLSEIARALDGLGYAPHPFRGVSREEARRREDRAALVRIGVAGAIAGNVMLPALALYAGDAAGMEPQYEQLFRWVSFGLTIPAVLFPGRVFFTGAWAALRTRTLHMDLPIALALSAGFVRGAINTITDSGPIYFDGVTALIFLLLIGRFLQQRGQRAATDASELLFSLTPDTAHRVTDDGTEVDLPAAALVPGMRVAVRTGEAFPADGVVRRGASRVNAALLTGESRPAPVAPGDQVHAGTFNLTSPLQIEVEAAGATSRVARLLAQVEESARRRAPVVAMADRMSGVFVAVVLMLAVVTFLIWVGQDQTAAWDHAIALLIVTCPCALALATPLAVTSAIGRAARGGIFIKGGDALERLARPGDLLLDKTGTLTEGQMALVEWRVDQDVRPLVLALEHGSTHPIADAFRRAWPDVAVGSAEAVEHRVGHGVQGLVDGLPVMVGSPRFIAEALGLDAKALPTVDDPSLTPVVVAVDSVVVGIAGIGDRIRDDAAAALARLRGAGWRTTMLSGDVAEVAATVGHRLGFPPAQIIAGATPEMKRDVVERLLAMRDRTGPVVMVGDGVNDAVAIARADVGIGVRGGAEACLASADIFLGAPGLEPLGRLAVGAQRTMRLVRRNIGWAIGYNVIGVTLAMSGVLSPLVAAVMMPASSLTVVLVSWLSHTFDPAPPVPVVPAALDDTLPVAA